MFFFSSPPSAAAASLLLVPHECYSILRFYYAPCTLCTRAEKQNNRTERKIPTHTTRSYCSEESSHVSHRLMGLTLARGSAADVGESSSYNGRMLMCAFRVYFDQFDQARSLFFNFHYVCVWMTTVALVHSTHFICSVDVINGIATT